MGLISWLKNLFKRKQKTKYYAEVKGWPEKWEMERPGVYVPRKLPKPGSQIIRKGYGKHFKGKGSKHQHREYRKSVKAKIQPEED